MPLRSSFIPELRQVQPPHIASCESAGVRIIGTLVPQLGHRIRDRMSPWVQHQMAFGYHDPVPPPADVYSHTKSNEAYGFGDGNCSTNFRHWNFQCFGCPVTFRLDY